MSAAHDLPSEVCSLLATRTRMRENLLDASGHGRREQGGIRGHRSFTRGVNVWEQRGDCARNMPLCRATPEHERLAQKRLHDMRGRGLLRHRSCGKGRSCARVRAVFDSGRRLVRTGAREHTCPFMTGHDHHILRSEEVEQGSRLGGKDNLRSGRSRLEQLGQQGQYLGMLTRLRIVHEHERGRFWLQEGSGKEAQGSVRELIGP